MNSKIKIVLHAILFIVLQNSINAQVSESFTFNQKELIFQKNADFDELTTKDYSFTEEIGNPQLPTRIESFVVPYDAIVSGISVTSVTKQKLKGEFYVYPTQPKIISDEYMHGYHIVTVKIYPVEYIPKNSEVVPFDGNVLVSLLIINQS